jgi:hypothetical protein
VRLISIVIVCVLVFAACGGDIHEVEVKPKAYSKTSSSSVKTIPQKPTTTTTTIDPKVQELLILHLKQVMYSNAADKFLKEQAARRQQQQQQAVANRVAHTDAWWQGVARCEQGGRNDPFFGYFSIMDGSAGGLDWSTQVGMANRIIARHGDYAWASACVAAGYGASPNG